MKRLWAVCCAATTVYVLVCAGCRSPYRSDQGALFGGLLGAGTGAVIGHAVGNTGAGAAIGAGVGAISGAAIGDELDQIEAQNRALIEQKMGQQLARGAVTIHDVIAMTRAGVDEELIVNHIRCNGVAAPLQANDIITLRDQGVSKQVIAAMQVPPTRPATQQVQPIYAPQPVIVEEHIYGPPPWWGYPRYYRYYHRHRPGVSWGLSISN